MKNNFNIYDLHSKHDEITRKIIGFKTRGINQKNCFNLKNFTIDFDGKKENIAFNFDNGEFIKIKDTRIIFGLATTRDGDDYYSSLKFTFMNNHANLTLLRYGESSDLGTDNHACVEYKDLENLKFNLTGYYAIFLDLDKLNLDPNIEISNGVLSILKEIAEEENLEELRKIKKERDEIEQIIKLKATIGEFIESQYDKNKKLLSDYINFLKKENLTKEINIIYHYGHSHGLISGYHHYQANYGSWSTKTSKKLCRDKIKNLIIDNAKHRGFDLSFIDNDLRNLILSKVNCLTFINTFGVSCLNDLLNSIIGDYDFFTYRYSSYYYLNSIIGDYDSYQFKVNLNLKEEDFEKIFEIDSVKEFFKNHFFQYNFKTSLVGEQHNQRWVVESVEIIEKIKQ